MDNQELLTQIAQMMEVMEARMDQKMSSMEARINQRIDQMEVNVKDAIVKNNVAIGETLTEALDPISRDIREIKEDAALLRADNAKNTLDIARLKLAK